MSRSRLGLGMVLLVLLALGPSWPWRGNPFLRDDEALVASNPAVRERLPLARYFTDPGTFSRMASFNRACYRPLTPLTFAWDAARSGGFRPQDFRVPNLLLHALTALLVLGFLRAALRELAPDCAPATRDRVALGAALLFAAHPYAAFSAQYVSNRSLLFMAAGYFLALWSYVAAWSSPRPGLAHARTAACFGLALCGKENAITLPAICLLLELLRPGASPRWSRAAGPAALAVAYLGWRQRLGLGLDQTNVQPTGSDALAYVLGQLRVQLTQYLPAYAWPEPIRWEPSGPPATLGDPLAWVALAAAIAWVGFALRRRREDPVLALALLAYPVPQLPTLLLAQPLPVLFYRPYPSSPFLFLAVLWLLRERLLARRGLGGLALALLLAVAGSYRVGWHQRTLAATWLHSVEHGALPRAHFFLAAQVEDPLARGDAYDRVIARYPNFVRTYAERAKERLLVGDSAGALEDLEQVVRRETQVPDYFLFTALAARAAGRDRLEEQARERLAALGWPPSWSGAVGFAERALASGRPALARDVIVLMGPRQDVPWLVPYVQAVAHHQLGELDAAIAQYRAALPGARSAGATQVAGNLGRALVARGRCREAAEVLAAAPGAQAVLAGCTARE